MTIFGVLTKNIVMSDLDLINKRFQQQDEFIDFLRIRITALENLLKNNIPDFEKQLVIERLKIDEDFQKKMKDKHPE